MPFQCTQCDCWRDYDPPCKPCSRIGDCDYCGTECDTPDGCGRCGFGTGDDGTYLCYSCEDYAVCDKCRKTGGPCCTPGGDIKKDSDDLHTDCCESTVCNICTKNHIVRTLDCGHVGCNYYAELGYFDENYAGEKRCRQCDDKREIQRSRQEARNMIEEQKKANENEGAATQGDDSENHETDAAKKNLIEQQKKSTPIEEEKVEPDPKKQKCG